MANQIILIPIVLAVIVVFFLFTNPIENTLLGSQLEKFTSVDWSEVKERDIVKNTVPIELIESQDITCKVYAEKFYLIVDHDYFTNSKKLINELDFDNSTSTLFLPCEELSYDSPALHVWYVLEESDRHSGKYEYFITELGDKPIVETILED